MKYLTLATLCATLCLPAAVAAQTTPPLPDPVQVSFVNTDGTQTGTATLTETDPGVLIKLELEGLPANAWLGFHIHETGSCDPHTDHESAGGHFNPADVEHGVLSETGPHAGDMPNIRSDAEGVARVEVLNTLVTLAEGEASLRGRALMVHADPDDHLSQPTGGAGDRLACAVID